MDLRNQITQSITNGNTSESPSSDAVFDALALKENSLGFTPENVSNKQTNLAASATKYPTVDAVNTGLGNLIPKHDGATYDTNAIQTVTAAEYAAIVTPNASTIYFIV